MPKIPSTEEILKQIDSIQQLPEQIREAVAVAGPDAANKAADLAQQKVNHVLLLLRQMLEVTDLHRELKEENG